MIMNIKTSCLVLLFMLQYALAMDSKNCTNATGGVFVSTRKAPKMKFYLYTHKNVNNEQQIIPWNKDSLLKSNYDKFLPTRIIIHGFKNSFFSCFNGYVKDAYLKKGKFNVFVVDWSDWSRNSDYPTVAKSIFKFLGKKVGNFTNFLHKHGEMPFNNMYLIGHSLGAQMSGAAGQFIKPNQYNTIFALDPAGPYFLKKSDEFRLDSSDAKYVEQISTNMGEFGFSGKVVGGAAFYPNYGRVQKYCLVNDAKKMACSHSAAYWYFAESINSKIGFCGKPCPLKVIDDISHVFNTCPKQKCDSKKHILMGGEPSIHKTGTYYVSTNFNPPFAMCKCKK